MGKGDKPRPANKKVYDREYERIYGRECTACRGKGFHWDECTLTKKMVKTNCLLCNGTGKAKHQPGCPDNDLEKTR